MTMTPAQLEEIKARADVATPGPWTVHAPHHYTEAAIHGPEGDGHGIIVSTYTGAINPLQDVAFIAHARTDAPALLAEIERVRLLAKAIHRWHLDGTLPSDDWVRNTVEGTYPASEANRP